MLMFNYRSGFVKKKYLMKKLGKSKNKRSRSEKGFTLLELLAVMGLLAILLALASLKGTDILVNARERVCQYNRTQLIKKYESHLVAIGEEHSETLLAGFILEEGENICPSHGTISIVAQNLLCSVHDIDEDEDEVPYLLK
jgi:prepilin-type N-terminal cleavage/methylation domain-containing protein